MALDVPGRVPYLEADLPAVDRRGLGEQLVLGGNVGLRLPRELAPRKLLPLLAGDIRPM